MARLPFDTAVQGIGWPGVPIAQCAAALGILYQLELTQWWSASEIAEHQWQQMSRVLDHAQATTHFYRDRLSALRWSPGETMSPSRWADMPVLTRPEAQAAQADLVSSQIPPSHGRSAPTTTSGSTGRPLTTHGTELTQLFWKALTLRDHLWHNRDFTLDLAVIREFGASLPPEGTIYPNWGTATSGVLRTGFGANLSIQRTVAEQARWLVARAPAYLLSYPSNIRALAQYFIRHQMALPSLRQVRTFGEVLEAGVRRACDDAWGVPLVDMYSAQEVGYLALQCPEGLNYHVQAEHLLVEVLDDRGRACRPGTTGRVVVSTLHNFATPLLRYEIGDFATVGEPCACGRSLPVLTRILGRQRNMFTLPNGDRVWPTTGQAADFRTALAGLPPMKQFQLIQWSSEDVEIKLVNDRRLTPEEETRLVAYFQKVIGYQFAVRFTYLDEIARSSGGKFEDFVSHVNA